MPFDLDYYLIRRKFLKIMGASFHILDAQEQTAGFCKQKAFKLKEDIRIYTDESLSQELLTIQARQVIDFSAAYDIVDPVEGRKVGAARRKGLSSLVRDSWEVLDENDQPIAQVQEDSMLAAMARRFLSNLIPQKFTLRSFEGNEIASLAVRFNPIIYKLEVNIDPASSIDRRTVLGVAVLISAIEGRQQ